MSPTPTGDGPEGDDFNKERAATMAAFETALKEDLEQRKAAAVALLHEGLEAEALDAAISDLFVHTARVVGEAASELHHANYSMTRRQLKAQSTAFFMKLEVSRTASEVAMTNQKVELEATAERKMDAKIRDYSSNEGSLLAEAQAKSDALQEKLEAAVVSAKSLEGALVDTQKAAKSADSRAVKAEEETERLRMDAESAQTELRDALADLEGTRNENQTLGEQIRDLVQAYEDAKKARDEVQAQLEAAEQNAQARVAEVEAERDAALKKLEGAAAEAAAALEAAAASHTLAMNALREELAQQQEAAIASALASEREESKRALEAVRAEMSAMVEAQSKLTNELASTRDELRSAHEATKAAEVEMARVKKEAEAAGAGALTKLKAAEAQVLALNSQISTVQDELSKTLSELDIKTDENLTLGQQVKQLVDEFESSKTEISRSKQQLDDAFAKARAKGVALRTDDKATLVAKVGELIRHFEDGRGQIVQSQESLDKALKDHDKSSAADHPELTAQVDLLAMRYAGAKKEIAESQSQLAQALKDMGVLSDTKRSLSEQLKDLLDKFTALRNMKMDQGSMQQEMDRIRLALREVKESLAEAMSAVGSLTNDKTRLSDDNRKMSDQVMDLVTTYKALKAECDHIKRTLNEALSSVGALQDEKMTLSEHVTDLAERYHAALKDTERIKNHLRDALHTVGDLTDDKRSLSEQIMDFIEMYNNALQEIRVIKLSLNDALSSVGGLKKDKRKLSDQIHDVLTQYKASKREHMVAEAERARAARAAVEADLKVKRIAAASIHERATLVQAALRSMHDLRSHLTHTASGVRLQQPLHVEPGPPPLSPGSDEPDLASFMSWDEPTRWGSVHSKSEKILVTLRQPTVPPLDMTCASPPKSSRSARGPGGASPRLRNRPDRIALSARGELRGAVHPAEELDRLAPPELSLDPDKDVGVVAPPAGEPPAERESSVPVLPAVPTNPDGSTTRWALTSGPASTFERGLT